MEMNYKRFNTPMSSGVIDVVVVDCIISAAYRSNQSNMADEMMLQLV